jgi:hypothetical protein
LATGWIATLGNIQLPSIVRERRRRGRNEIMIDLLTGDHAEIGVLFDDLASEFDRGEPRRILARLDYLWARLAMHIRAEHLRLFPALLSASETSHSSGTESAPAPAEVRALDERLREDHDFFMRELAAAVNAARELVAQDGPPDGEQIERIRSKVLAVAERLVEHNRVEEEQVYLWPEALLSPPGEEELRAGIKLELDNLPPRFLESPPLK